MFGDGGLDPLAEPCLLVSPAHAFSGQDFADPTAFDWEPPLLGQVRRQAVECPTGKGPTQGLGIGQTGGDHLPHVLGGVGCGATGTWSVGQALHPLALEAIEPEAHRRRTHDQLLGDLRDPVAVPSHQHDAGAFDGAGGGGAGPGHLRDGGALLAEHHAGTAGAGTGHLLLKVPSLQRTCRMHP